MKARHATLVALAGTAVMLAVGGITLVSASSSLSATTQPGSSRTATYCPQCVGGRRTVTEKGVRFSFEVPAKAPAEESWWERFSSISTGKTPGGPISLNRSIFGPQGAEGIIYWTSFPDGDHADPCAHLLAPSIGRSAAALAASVATAPGTKLVEGPSKLTLGGHPAKHVVLKVRKNVGCDPGFFYRWKDHGLRGAFWQTTEPGDTIRVWIVAVDGTRLFIAAATKAGGLEKEIQQIVESIRFG